SARYGLAYTHRESLFGPATAAETSAGGWLRRALAAMATAQELRITLPGGSASLGLASKPGPASSQSSPELTLQLGAEGSALTLLPADLRQTISQLLPLRIRWNLDH